MAVAVQHARVIRRKLLDRCASVGGLTVVGYEPKSAPEAKKTVFCAIVNGPGRAVPQASTLTNTTVWQSFIIYLYLQLPLATGSAGSDAAEMQVDARVSDARDTLLDVVHQPITYGDAVELDAVGAYGDPIRWAPGYLDQEGTKYRAETITPGFVAFNVWEQTRT